MSAHISGCRSRSERTLNTWRYTCIAFAALTVVLGFACATLSDAARADEFNPQFSLQVRPPFVDSVPEITATVRQGVDEPALKTARIKFPVGFKVNNPNGLRHCPKEDFGADNFEAADCPEESVVGTASADAVLQMDPGNPDRDIELQTSGDIYLLSTRPSQDPVQIGLSVVPDLIPIPIKIIGEITLEGEVGHEQIVANFVIPPPPLGEPENMKITRFEMSLTGGDAGLLRSPVASGHKRYEAQFTGHGDPEPQRARDGLLTIFRLPDGEPERAALVFEPTLATRPSTSTAGDNPPLLFFNLGGDIGNGASSFQSLERMAFRLPKGMAGNPFALRPRCAAGLGPEDWANDENLCAQSIVGIVSVTAVAALDTHRIAGSVYLSDPPPDSTDPAALRFVFPSPPRRINNGEPIVLDAGIKLSGNDLRVEAVTENLPTVYEIRNLVVFLGGSLGGPDSPFITNPTACAQRNFDGVFTSDKSVQTTVSGADTVFTTLNCAALPFAPILQANLLDGGPSAPTGISTEIEQQRGEAHLKSANVVFPPGFRANSVLDGISPCVEANIDNCNDESKVGTAEATSPLLADAPLVADRQLTGDVYLMATDPGKPLKLAVYLRHGHWDIAVRMYGTISVKRDSSGRFRIETRFSDLPELQIENFRLTIQQQLIKNPPSCGNHEVEGSFSGHNGASFDSRASIEVEGCNGALDAGPFAPNLSFTPSTTAAGAHPDLTVGLNRPSGHQAIKTVRVNLPEGMAVNPNAAPICSDDQVNRSTCPVSSKIGEVNVRALIYRFLDPLNLQGDVYMAAPKGGDPGAVAVDVELPEIAGGGHLVLKGRALIRDRDKGIDVVFDDLPTDFDIQEISMTLNGDKGINQGRPLVTNPTFCTANPARALFTGEAGTSVNKEAPYNSANCGGLPFGPKLEVALSTTVPNRVPAITTVITQGPGEATTESISLEYPKGMQLNIKHRLSACSAVQRAARSCPADSRLGSMEVHSPLLLNPLRGDVFFGEGGRIHMFLNGLISLDLDGKADIDVLAAKVRFTLSGLPSMPMSRSVVHLEPGLIKNPAKCPVGTFTGSFRSHSGMTSTATSSVDSGCQRTASKNKLKLKVSLKPKRANRYPKARFIITQPKKSSKKIRSFYVRLGKGKKAMRASTKRLARRGRARRKGRSIGRITLSPSKGSKVKAIVYGKKRRIRVKADRRYMRKLSKNVRKLRRRYKKAKGSKRRLLRKRLVRSKKNRKAVQRTQRHLRKKMRIYLRKNKLQVKGVPSTKFRRIELKLYGKRDRTLRNPKRAGTIKFAGRFKLSSKKTARADAKVKVRRGKKKTKKRKRK